jgi:hypothetical protein
LFKKTNIWHDFATYYTIFGILKNTKIAISEQYYFHHSRRSTMTTILSKKEKKFNTHGNRSYGVQSRLKKNTRVRFWSGDDKQVFMKLNKGIFLSLNNRENRILSLVYKDVFIVYSKDNEKGVQLLYEKCSSLIINNKAAELNLSVRYFLKLNPDLTLLMSFLVFTNLYKTLLPNRKYVFNLAFKKSLDLHNNDIKKAKMHLLGLD